MYLISTKEANDLVEKFQNGTLPKIEWTHEAHLIVGLYAVLTHREKAMDFMRDHIRRYNEAVGTVNSDTSGYHETLTAFWIWMLRCFVTESELQSFDEVAVDVLIFEELFSKRNIWLKFYSRECVLSVEARQQFLEPNVMPMNFENYRQLYAENDDATGLGKI